MGEKYEGIMKYRVVVTEQSWKCKVRHREYSQRYSDNCEWCQMSVRFIRMLS